jgi:hypothetical protein
MRREQNDAGQFEWVNAWAASAMADTSAIMKAEPVAEAPPKVAVSAAVSAPGPVIAPVAPALPQDQLMRDIAEIERARDALDALPVGGFSARRRQALTLVPARTTDPVPVVVGGVLALVMLTVFGAAAAMTKLAR